MQPYKWRKYVLRWFLKMSTLLKFAYVILTYVLFFVCLLSEAVAKKTACYHEYPNLPKMPLGITRRKTSVCLVNTFKNA